jgi:hypothetical protein
MIYPFPPKNFTAPPGRLSAKIDPYVTQGRLWSAGEPRTPYVKFVKVFCVACATMNERREV